jgi:predicted secreted protein
MAASAGRQITLFWGEESPAVEIQGLREKGIELNGEPIDVTSDDDNGWRTLLTVPAENQINISLSGVSKDDTLKTDWFAGNRTKEATITFADGGTMVGTFIPALLPQRLGALPIPSIDVHTADAHIAGHLADEERIALLPIPRCHQPAEMLGEPRAVLMRPPELAAPIQAAAEADAGPGEAVTEIAPLEDDDVAAMHLLTCNRVLPPGAPHDKQVRRIRAGADPRIPPAPLQSLAERLAPFQRALVRCGPAGHRDDCGLH